ncbi:hypothetical protein OH76DRAFT_162190 [Lentinus brumalis]|uniref:Uncharacterized protein n=1 Tax=Lentinus brumalis TaxID=2498619 RepID=A0A371DIZ0_9APHY|nr:hypothetical protein OH76DRAFT_162190 [Polyporus brumalis]
MVRLFSIAGLVAFAGLLMSAPAAPTASRRQLGNLQCNIDRGEIFFHVAQLGQTAASLDNATALVALNNSTHADIMAMKAGAAGAAEAIKLILTGVLNGKAANPLFRDAVGGNFTMVLNALNDLNSTHPTTAALLKTANTQYTNSLLAAEGVVNNCDG